MGDAGIGVDRPGAPEAVYRGWEDSVPQWRADQQTIYVVDLKAIG